MFGILLLTSNNNYKIIIWEQKYNLLTQNNGDVNICMYVCIRKILLFMLDLNILYIVFLFYNKIIGQFILIRLSLIKIN